MTITARLRRGTAIALASLFALVGVVALGPTAQAASQELALDELAWKYLDDDTDPSPEDPHAWAAPDFDDSSWPEATGSFGALRGELGELNGGFTPDNLLTQYQAGTETNVPAFFFRSTLDVSASVLDEFTTFQAEFLYDDAISVYVNGTYVGGGHDSELMALDNPNRTHGGSNHSEPNPVTVRIPAELLVAGENTVAVRLHNGRPNSSDVYFEAVRAIMSDDVDLASVEWRYLDDNTDPSPEDPHAWAAEDFDDSSWPTASGSFGAKDGELAELSGGFMPQNLLKQYKEGSDENAETFFFRGDVHVPEGFGQDAVSIVGRFHYDDAISVFVNGTYAGGGHDAELMGQENPNLSYGGSNAGAPILSEIHIDPDLLRTGDNTIAVRLHNGRDSSSDVYFDGVSLEVNTEAPEGVINEVLLGGATPLDRGFVWYSSSLGADTRLQLARTADLEDGSFAEDDETLEPEDNGTSEVPFYDYNQVSVEGLEADTSYSWRVGNDEEGWTETYEFATQTDEDFEFLFVGDPQIGSSGNAERDGEGWANTLGVATDMFPDIELLVSAGDQVETASNENEYRQLLAPEQMKELTFVPTIGNHDVAAQRTYDQHFLLPNYDQDTTRDHWYGYGDVQFIHINTDWRDDYDVHRAWLEDVLAKGGDYKYKVVVLHRSLFSTANHSQTSTTESLRRYFANLFSELDIDLVLAGHDHSYTRTHLMDGTTPTTEGVQAEQAPGEGEVQHVTFNSSSGSKYYDITEGADPTAGEQDEYYDYVSVTQQLRTPTFGHVAVDQCSITVTNYRADTREVTDSVRLDLSDEATLTIPGDETIGVADVEGFDPEAGVEIEQCPGAGYGVEVSGEVLPEVGEYELGYQLVDADGAPVGEPQTRTITVAQAAVEIVAEADAVRFVGDEASLTGTADVADGAEVTGEVLVDEEWVEFATSTVVDGRFELSLTGVDEAGEHRLRATIGEDSSEPVAFERMARTAHGAVGYKVVGETTNAWGTVAGPATVRTEVRIGDRWVRSQSRDVEAGFFAIPLTYGAGSAGSYEWRIVVEHENGLRETSGSWTLHRVAKPTAAHASTRRASQRTNVWGTVTPDARVWTEVRIGDRWVRSQQAAADADGGYVIELTYGLGKAGSYAWRVGTELPDGTSAYSNAFTLTRR